MDKLSYAGCLKNLWPYLRPYKKGLIIGLTAQLIAQLTYALLPSIEGKITSRLQLDLTNMATGIPGAHIQMDLITKILAGLAFIYLIKISSQVIYTFFLTDAIQKTMYDLRNAVEQKVNRLPVSYFDGTKTGDLLSRITNDTEAVSNGLQQTLSRVIALVCTLVFSLTMMLQISAFMTCLSVLSLILAGLISVVIVRRSQNLFDARQEALARLTSVINEMYEGSGEIRAYNQQAQAEALFDEANRNMRISGFKAQTASGIISPTTGMVTYLTIGVCALYGCLQVLAGKLLLGGLQAFIRYIWAINDPVSQLSQLMDAIQSAFAGMSRLFRFLNLDEISDHNESATIDEIDEIRFNQVGFSYTEKPLMKDISFAVKKGQKVAVVGPTGAGKTTLTSLLLRFYDPKSGSITINGIDTRTLSRKEVRQLFGVVLQDAWLFEGSIEENLKFANPQATDEDMKKAAFQAKIAPVIERLPQGYQTKIRESLENISQGEKQLLTIARAFLKNPQVLILDEATSSVDTRLEKRLQQAMQEIMAGRTSFVIAHRLSTILSCDLILVMENGELAESGSHEELLKLGGLYKKLYESQFADLDIEMD